MPLEFSLWYVDALGGWCVPTLLIRNASRRSSSKTDRTYATTLDGKPVRIGMGPHVSAIARVYVRASRKAALQRYLDLQSEGSKTAHEIRDRISSRRAQSALRRRFF